MNKETHKTLNFFWIGFSIYTLSFTLSATTYVSYIVCQIFQIIGILLFVPAAIYLIQFRFENSYLKTIFILYCTWLFTVIIRGFLFDYTFVKQMLFDAWLGLFPYFVPLVLLFPNNLSSLKKVANTIVILGIFYIIFDIIFLKDLLYPYGMNMTSMLIIEFFSHSLSIPCGFLLLTYSYHSKSRKLIAIIVIMLTFLFAVIRARRSLMLLSISPLVFSFILYFLRVRIKLHLLIISLILGMLLFKIGLNIYNENKNGVFNYITTKISQDTRSGVELRFYQDMNSVDWIFGRGINGQYYCPGIERGNITGQRSVIETGYLNIILKGGVISLVLLLLIAIPAVVKGLFYSNNLLSKAASIWVLLFLIGLYPVVYNTFTLNYLLVWISIGICYGSSIRMKTDEEIKNAFLNK